MASPTRMRSQVCGCLIGILMAATAAAAQAEAPATLPTPFSAEQIRDAWVADFWVDTRTRQGDEESLSRTVVTSWSETGATMTEQAVVDGALTGKPTEYTVTWVQLRDHATFPASAATRERVRRETTLGAHDGWLYVLEAEGKRSEFFFADAFPGPPISFRQFQGDTLLMDVEHVARHGVDASVD